MKALAVGLALILGIGCLVAANWLGSQSRPPERPAAVTGDDQGKTPPPVLPAEPDAPAIAAQGPYPKAVAAETEHNFGTAMQHSKGHHEFVIRNEGEAPLELVALRKDRTCSAPAPRWPATSRCRPAGKLR